MRLELKFHPAAEQPFKALLTAAFLACMGGMMFFMLNSAVVVGLLMLAVLYSLIPFFFPTYYTFDEETLTMKRLGRTRVYAWNKYRSFMVQKNGIVLWTVADLTAASANSREKMAVLRNSVFLPMTSQMMKQAEEILRKKLAVTITGE